MFVKVAKSYVVNNHVDGCVKMYCNKFATSQTLIISFLKGINFKRNICECNLRETTISNFLEHMKVKDFSFMWHKLEPKMYFS